MGETKPTSVNARRAVAVMRQIADNISADPRVTVKIVADRFDMKRSMFYRWKTDEYAGDIKLGVLADLADWLHTEYDHPDFMAMWQQARLTIQ